MNRWPDGRPLSIADLERIAVEHGVVSAERLEVLRAAFHNEAMFASTLRSLTSQVRYNLMCDGELALGTTSPRPPAVIFDRDGTLASVAHHMDSDGDVIDWRTFHGLLPFDSPVPVIAALLRSIRPGVARIMTTGREATMALPMEAWLNKHDLPIDILLMRPAHDQRKDHVVKQEMFDRGIRPYFDVRFVVDDRPSVVEMWRANGLSVLAVTDPGIPPRFFA